MLKKILNYRRDEKLIRKFFSALPEFTPTRGRVLQYVGISSMFLTPTEILFYHLLRHQGFEVDYLVYDETVPIFETITKKTTDPATAPHRNWQAGKAKLKAGQVSYENIPIAAQAWNIASELDGIDSILDFVYEEIDFGDIVGGTLYRYYQSSNFGEDVESISQKMLVTALSNYLCVKHLYQKHRYEFLAFSHGINITWQPVAKFCQRENIPFVCYDRAKVKEHGNFNAGQSSADWSFDSAWARHRDRTLTEEEKERSSDYLKERELQKGDVFKFNSSRRATNLAEEKERLGIPVDRKCITFFSNLIWDAANVSRDIAFTSFLECITESIRYFKDRKDVQILIRSHPAEKLIGTDARYGDLVLAHFGAELPKNVTVISPEDDVNSFTVIDLSTVGVVNTSTVGLEMAILGKRALLVSETHYRDKGFTDDIVSPSHFFETIETALKNPDVSPKKQRLAEKYFFMMMFLYQKHLPVRYEGDVFQGYAARYFSELSNTEPLVQIAECLVKGVPNDFIQWPVLTDAKSIV